MDTKTPPGSLGGFLAAILGNASDQDCNCPNCSANPREKTLLTGDALEAVRTFETVNADLKAQRDTIKARMAAATAEMCERVKAGTGWNGDGLSIDIDHIDLGVVVLSRPKPAPAAENDLVEFAPEGGTDTLRHVIVEAAPFIRFHIGAEGAEGDKAAALMEKLRTLGIVVDPEVDPTSDGASGGSAGQTGSIPVAA